MIKLIFFLLLSIVLKINVFTFEYSSKVEDNFFDNSYDNIQRFKPLYFTKDQNIEHLVKDLSEIASKIKKEEKIPHSSFNVSIVYHISEDKKITSIHDINTSLYNYFIDNNISTKNFHTYVANDPNIFFPNIVRSDQSSMSKIKFNIYSHYYTDDDNDKVYSDRDKCPNSKPTDLVDENGCAAKLLVVLLKGKKAKSKIIISNNAGDITIDKQNAYTLISDKDSSPSKPKKMDTTTLNKILGSVKNDELTNKRYILYFNQDTLTDKSQENFHTMIEELKHIKNPIVKIIGHTDTTANNQFNYTLGLKRATVIKSILLKSNLNFLKIEAISYGEENLAVKTPNNTNEPKNRRVEVLIQ